MKKLLLLLLLCLVVGPVAVFFTAVEPQPIVAQRVVASPADAARARATVGKLRALSASSRQKYLRLSEADMNSVLITGLRAFKVVRGRANVEGQSLRLQFSADATWVPAGGWLNLDVEIPQSEQGLKLSSVKLGPYKLPAQLLLPASSYIADMILGDGLGHVAVGAVDSVVVNGRQVVFGVGLDAQERQALSKRTKDLVRATASISTPEQVRAYIDALDSAVNEGLLSRRGSVVPFLKYALSVAHQKATDDPNNEEIKAALLALAIYCGHFRVEQLVGQVVSDNIRSRPSGCSGNSLQGRGDLRQHFTISAGLQAASNSGVAFAIGEFKELLDSNTGGSGFSFDDLAADRAGIAFADAFLEADREEQQGLLNSLTAEAAVMPRTSDLPSGMSQLEFKRRFGDVDSAAYKELVAKIDQRIARLPIQRNR